MIQTKELERSMRDGEEKNAAAAAAATDSETQEQQQGEKEDEVSSQVRKNSYDIVLKI